jgi:hypothetical protein
VPGCLQLAAKEPAGLLNASLPLIDDFLCRALRGEPAPWSGLDSGVSTAEFLHRCELQGVQSLLYHTMRVRQEWIKWPPEVRRILEESSKTHLAQEMLRAHYLLKLLRSLADRGVNCLLTKGEALANTLYPTPGTRTRCDSDLFIRIADIDLVRQAALDAGFVIVSPVYKSHQFVVRRRRETTDVFEFDVHWRILNAPRFARTLSFEQAYRNSMKLPGLEPARALDAVDSLLLACMHRSGSDRHDQDRLIWIYDIHLLVSAMPLKQLGEFATKAVLLDVQGSCLRGLTRANECFGTAVPEEIMRILASPEVPPTLRRRYAQSNLGLLIDDWRQLPDARARRALLGELFLPSSESLLHKYGKQNLGWVPLLWLRQVFGGLVQRISLR